MSIDRARQTGHEETKPMGSPVPVDGTATHVAGDTAAPVVAVDPWSAEGARSRIAVLENLWKRVLVSEEKHYEHLEEQLRKLEESKEGSRRDLQGHQNSKQLLEKELKKIREKHSLSDNRTMKDVTKELTSRFPFATVLKTHEALCRHNGNGDELPINFEGLGLAESSANAVLALTSLYQLARTLPKGSEARQKMDAVFTQLERGIEKVNPEELMQSLLGFSLPLDNRKMLIDQLVGERFFVSGKALPAVRRLLEAFSLQDGANRPGEGLVVPEQWAAEQALSHLMHRGYAQGLSAIKGGKFLPGLSKIIEIFTLKNPGIIKRKAKYFALKLLLGREATPDEDQNLQAVSSLLLPLTQIGGRVPVPREPTVFEPVSVASVEAEADSRFVEAAAKRVHEAVKSWREEVNRVEGESTRLGMCVLTDAQASSLAGKGRKVLAAIDSFAQAVGMDSGVDGDSTSVGADTVSSAGAGDAPVSSLSPSVDGEFEVKETKVVKEGDWVAKAAEIDAAQASFSGSVAALEEAKKHAELQLAAAERALKAKRAAREKFKGIFRSDKARHAQSEEKQADERVRECLFALAHLQAHTFEGVDPDVGHDIAVSMRQEQASLVKKVEAIRALPAMTPMGFWARFKAVFSPSSARWTDSKASSRAPGFWRRLWMAIRGKSSFVRNDVPVTLSFLWYAPHKTQTGTVRTAVQGDTVEQGRRLVPAVSRGLAVTPYNTPPLPAVGVAVQATPPATPVAAGDSRPSAAPDADNGAGVWPRNT